MTDAEKAIVDKIIAEIDLARAFCHKADRRVDRLEGDLAAAKRERRTHYIKYQDLVMVRRMMQEEMTCPN